MHEYIKQNGITKILARCGIISAIYIVLSLIPYPIASGVIQFRVGECLTLLPLVLGESIISVTIGCLVVNIITGCVVYDTILGSLVTFIAGILTFIVGKLIKKTPLKILVGGLFPVILNAIFIPLFWYFAGLNQEQIYIVQVLSLMVSQALSVYCLGSILIVKSQKYKLFK